MEELIKSKDTPQGKRYSALSLYDFLGLNKAHWNRWYKKNIIQNSFSIEGYDWEGFTIMVNGNETKDFDITLDFAKRLSMTSRTGKGEEVRNYFLKCEKIAEKAIKPMSQLEVLQFSVNHLVEQSKRIEAVEEKVKQIEAKQITHAINDYTIAGYGALIEIKVDLPLAASLGKKASSICNQMGYITGTMPDPRFGRVKTYPSEVLDTVFNEYKKNLNKMSTDA